MGEVVELRRRAEDGPELLPPPLGAKTAAAGLHAPCTSPSAAPVGPTPPKSEGPPLPPLAVGLPNTPIENIQTMFAHVFLCALREGDTEWVRSDDFLLVAEYAGLSEPTALAVRELYLSGRLDMKRITYTFCGFAQDPGKERVSRVQV